jgi:hypothetical protein
MLGKIFFANRSGLGWWENSGLLAKPQVSSSGSDPTEHERLVLGDRHNPWQWRTTIACLSLHVLEHERPVLVVVSNHGSVEAFFLCYGLLVPASVNLEKP